MFARRRVLQSLLVGVTAPLPFARAQVSASGSHATPARAAAADASRRVVFGTGPTRVALLIESQSADFASAAKAVIAGVKSAWGVEGRGVAVEVIPLGDNDESLLRTVNALGRRGFSLALGPLTRDNVNLIADLGSLPVPILALNLPDADRQVPYNIAFFSLAIEGEGRQVASEAFSEAASRIAGGRSPQALMVGDTSPLARRGLAAYGQRWGELGGGLIDSVEIDGVDAGEWRALLADASADTAFAVVSPDDLPLVRAALPMNIPLFGTSQFNAVQTGVGNRGSELDGVRLIDMPWQIDPANTAVMAYPREKSLRHLDFQRLYALGIDAYRIGQLLMQGEDKFELDGVTGWLRVNLRQDLRVQRQAVAAEFRGGQIVPLRAAAR